MVTVTKKHADEFATMNHSLAVALQEIAKMPNGSHKRRATEELRKTQAMLSKHNTYKMREANRAQAFLSSLKHGGKQNEDTIRNQIVTLLQVLDDQHEQMTVKALLVALGKVEDLRPVDRTSGDRTDSAKVDVSASFIYLLSRLMFLSRRPQFPPHPRAPFPRGQEAASN
jgi:hypothetical protein